MGKKLKIITQDISIPTIIAVASIKDPKLAVFFTFLSGVITTVSEWKKKRAEEVINNVGIERIIRLIQRDDKTRDILHKILENVMDESSKKKRKLFYNYIHKLDNNIHKDFDYHSKLIAVVNEITFNELDMLLTFSNIFLEVLKIIRRKDIKSKIPKGVNVADIFKHKYFTYMSPRLLDSFLLRLSSYDLIYAEFGLYDGTAYGPVTYFGKIFIDFISDD